MRIMIKGGVWKNSEDEVLKAAIMKYGKNNWARVASLLPRKTSKQCKARWFEWLDPSIKKTEWTRDEEERLLHLAKVMPTQWRTIGEIDPQPETKPARPDPIDMDEDEKEMLSEARARLANTRGKKAKRKAREKQLEEAKRLATLQKRRELKAAGINTRLNTVKRKRNEIDYAKEIPFEKLAPAGYYDTGAEDLVVEEQSHSSQFKAQFLDELEEKRRDEEEARLRMKDKKRMKALNAMNLPQARAKVSEINDPSSSQRRSKLVLPAPQVTEDMIEEIARLGPDGMPPPSALATPVGQTPARRGTDLIMDEARNLVALQTASTPLLGGSNADVRPGTGFGGIMPNTQAGGGGGGSGTMGTPMTERGAGTPMHNAEGMTPLSVVGGDAASVQGSRRGGAGRRSGPGATPLSIRDELGINREDGSVFSAATSSRARKTLQREQQQHLRSALASLPAPQYAYEVGAPDDEALLEDIDENEATALEEDAADTEARRAAALEAARQAELRRRSTVLQRELPRPLTADEEGVFPDDGATSAQLMVAEEMLTMLHHDAAKYPLKLKKKKKRGEPDISNVPALEVFEEEELAGARELVRDEVHVLESEVGVSMKSKEERMHAFVGCWERIATQYVYHPSEQKFVKSSSLSKTELVEAQAHEFQRLRDQMVAENKRAAKMEKKLSVLTKGFVMREQTAHEEIRDSANDLDNTTIELNCFQALADAEEAALPVRLRRSEAELKELEERETELQSQYGRLVSEIDDLNRVLAEAGVSVN